MSKKISIHWICQFGTLIQIHSDGGKEFCNNLADKVYKLLDIKHTKTSPAHPQCNAQVKVFNKTVAKYLASFVDNTTLDGEQNLSVLMLSYNTSYHSTIMTTPFELSYRVKARFPSIPNPDIQNLHYGKSFASERLQILKHARQLANAHSAQNSKNYKDQFDKSAAPHSYNVGDLMLFSE